MTQPRASRRSRRCSPTVSARTSSRPMTSDPAALLRDPRVVWVEDVLRFRDTDKNGHINNSVFSVLCESGRVNLFGLKFDPLLRPGTFYVIARGPEERVSRNAE